MNLDILLQMPLADLWREQEAPLIVGCVLSGVPLWEVGRGENRIFREMACCIHELAAAGRTIFTRSAGSVGSAIGCASSLMYGYG